MHLILILTTVVRRAGQSAYELTAYLGCTSVENFPVGM